MTTPTHVAIDPRTGNHLRPATPAEVAAWEAQPGNPRIQPAFRRASFVAIRVGDVLIDEDTGPGIWYGGAGF